MTTNDQNPTKRRRGAPLGNTNNLQHGFYSRRRKSAELTDAENHEFSQLKEEIAVLRTYIRRIVERTAAVDDLDTLLSTLRVLNISLISLSRLLRTEKIIWPGQSRAEFDAEIQAALIELQKARVYWQQTDEETSPFDSTDASSLDPQPPVN